LGDDVGKRLPGCAFRNAMLMRQRGLPCGIHFSPDIDTKRAQTKVQRVAVQIDASRQRSERHRLTATYHASKSALDVPIEHLWGVAKLEGSAPCVHDQERCGRISMHTLGWRKRHDPAIASFGDETSAHQPSPDEVPHAKRHPGVRKRREPRIALRR